MKRVIAPEDCPASPKAQSEAIETEHLLFFAGQMATDYATGVAPEAAVDPDNPFAGPPPMARQTHVILRRMAEILESAGLGLEDLIRIEQFITGREEAAWYSATRQAYMSQAHPTSTRVVARALEVPGRAHRMRRLRAQAWFGMGEADARPRTRAQVPHGLSRGPVRRSFRCSCRA